MRPALWLFAALTLSACQTDGGCAGRDDRQKVDMAAPPFAVETAPAPDPGWTAAYDIALTTHLRALDTADVTRIRLSPLALDGAVVPWFVRIERHTAAGVGDAAMLIHDGAPLPGRGGAGAAGRYLEAIDFPRRPISAALLVRVLGHFGALPPDAPLGEAHGAPRLALDQRSDGATLTIVGLVSPNGGGGFTAPVEVRRVVRFDARGHLVE